MGESSQTAAALRDSASAKEEVSHSDGEKKPSLAFNQLKSSFKGSLTKRMGRAITLPGLKTGKETPGTRTCKTTPSLFLLS